MSRADSSGESTPTRTAHDAAHNAVVLEAVARMAFRTITLKANADEVSQALLDRHYFRKHGAGATYGQNQPVQDAV